MASRVRRWRKEAGPDLAFSVVLPPEVGALGKAPAARARLDEGLEVARLLEARVIVLRTPPSVRPTNANRRRIAEIAAELPAQSVLLCWEPQGLWEVDDVRRTAYAAGLSPVLDPTQEDLPPGSVVYTHIRALGVGRALGSRAIDRIAAALAPRREAYVVLDGGAQAGRLTADLEAAIARLPVSGAAAVRPVVGRLRADDEEQ